MTITLRFLSLLLIFPAAVLANPPQEVTYSASQLGLNKYFANATATLVKLSPTEYDATFDLGEITARRSGQDFMLYTPAIALLIHCTVWRLAVKEGHNAVVFRSAKSQKTRGIFSAHLTLATLPVSTQQLSSTEDLTILDLTTKEFQSTKSSLCERSIQDLNEKPW